VKKEPGIVEMLDALIALQQETNRLLGILVERELPGVDHTQPTMARRRETVLGVDHTQHTRKPTRIREYPEDYRREAVSLYEDQSLTSWHTAEEMGRLHPEIQKPSTKIIDHWVSQVRKAKASRPEKLPVIEAGQRWVIPSGGKGFNATARRVYEVSYGMVYFLGSNGKGRVDSLSNFQRFVAERNPRLTSWTPVPTKAKCLVCGAWVEGQMPSHLRWNAKEHLQRSHKLPAKLPTCLNKFLSPVAVDQ
jgi:hypothetical protein